MDVGPVWKIHEHRPGGIAFTTREVSVEEMRAGLEQVLSAAETFDETVEYIPAPDERLWYAAEKLLSEDVVEDLRQQCEDPLALEAEDVATVLMGTVKTPVPEQYTFVPGEALMQRLEVYIEEERAAGEKQTDPEWYVKTCTGWLNFLPMEVTLRQEPEEDLELFTYRCRYTLDRLARMWP